MEDLHSGTAGGINGGVEGEEGGRAESSASATTKMSEKEENGADSPKQILQQKAGGDIIDARAREDASRCATPLLDALSQRSAPSLKRGRGNTMWAPVEGRKEAGDSNTCATTTWYE